MSFPFLQSYLGLGSGLQTKNAGSGGTAGGWVELGRTTLGSAGATINVSSLSNKRYYMILTDADGNTNGQFTFNNDTGSNYSIRTSENGGADSTATSQSRIDIMNLSGSTPHFHIGYISNFSSKEKLAIIHGVKQNTAGAGTAALRDEIVGKWANTSNAISSMKLFTSSNTYSTGSEVVVLGYDPADTHSNNFWTELASTTLTSDSSTMSSGTFTAKKYLWVQYYTRQTTGGFTLRANGDSASNYHRRFSANGGAENTATSAQLWGNYDANIASFGNWFGINTSSNEKLFIGHVNEVPTSGAGTAPTRVEVVTKWANTSSQVTSLAFNLRDAGTNFLAGSCIKVWGSD